MQDLLYKPGFSCGLDKCRSRILGIGLPAGDFDFHRVLNLFVEQLNASGDNKKMFKQWFGFDQPALTVAY